MPLFSDEIADGVRQRDPRAISIVYETLADRLLGYLIARVHDRETAEDLLEATFVELMEKGFTIRGGADVIKAWLFRAAHFNALDHLRRRNRIREDLHEDDEHLERPDHDLGPEDHAVGNAVTREVRRAMAELSDEQQEVLLLRYVSGLTAPEVAEVIGKKVPAVRGLQHRGERALARVLERWASPFAASEGAPVSSQEETIRHASSAWGAPGGDQRG
ncbi:RNA polymerase sigma factor [Egibacter rhizosphaerae]|uniref:RNA polymerase sigma factor n=1 Tax=Egibacter rhizosphaerae TaxID=1670831 RepID=UPI0013F17365|nr:RNA polymerase sigma factor [Egibacter rhizosphaerae]